MEPQISPLSQVEPGAELGKGVVVGPFCLVGSDVVVGDFTELTSHVVLSGRTTLGSHNKLFPGCVIGGEPQDVSYQESSTKVVIGDDNIFREGVTVNRGAEKEDHVTRIGNRNMFMANSHVAHNCRIYDDVILVNGVLLGGHVHIHDRAIVSGKYRCSSFFHDRQAQLCQWWLSCSARYPSIHAGGRKRQSNIEDD